MSKWLEDLLLNIEIWLYRRLRRLLQHGDATFAGIDTLHAELAQKEQYRDGVYLHLRERLEGTDEKPLAEGVPVRPLPATQDLAHLQAAVELLADRKIEDASPDIPDGVSFERLLCDSTLAATITELVDTNSGWTMNRDIQSLFPNVNKLVLGCKESTITMITRDFQELAFPHLERWSVNGNISGIANVSSMTRFVFPKLVYLKGGSVYASQFLSGFIYKCNSLESVEFPLLNTLDKVQSHFYIICSCASLKEIIAPNMTTILCEYVVGDCPKLQKVVFGVLDQDFHNAYADYGNNFVGSSANLVHFEIGNGVAVSLHLNWWLATMAIRTDTTASDYIDLREDKDDSGEFIYQNNLQQFLSNFKAYIADRLADRTGKKTLTLTLSQAVRDVLTAEIEDIIVSQKHWVISPAKSV